MKTATLTLLFLTCGTAMAQEVSVKTLLPQMTDRTFLTHAPKPAFRMAQSSSYDRRSDPGPNSDPFANNDAGNFIRTEDGPNGKEYVMADLKGPGTVVRLWSANPSGTIRLYFDGEAKPRVVGNMADFLGGKMTPLAGPFAYVASSGYDVYFPFPYAKSLKITAATPDGKKPSLYYHVGYRTYPAGTHTKTFSWTDLFDVRAQMAKVADELTEPRDAAGIQSLAVADLDQGRTLTANLKPVISSAIRTFQVKIPVLPDDEAKALAWDDPRQTHNVLRNLILTMTFDGEKCVETPLGDFFGAAPGINPYVSFPMTVAKDGTMTCRFVMPFEKTADISIKNLGPKVRVQMSGAIKPYPWSADTYYFHAQWLGEHARTRPFRDMTFLDVQGQGFFVGSNMHIANPVPDWWGEGDEKAKVDGESFPSTFGTGSEDYYGYAWGSSQLFQRPYHAQTRCDGPGSMGHTNVNRWQLFDPISYTSSLKFTIEQWHWADVIATFVHTAYWYAKPGGTGPAEVDEQLLPPPSIEPMKPVPGAIEGESLPIVSKTGGTTEIQEGFWQCSGGKQLWWRDAKGGDKLVLTFPVPAAGTYEVIGNFCHAHDYGIQRMTLNGQEIAPIDFFGTGLDWKKQSLGTFTLPAGNVTLEIQCIGFNPASEPRGMFGLDYLLLNKK